MTLLPAIAWILALAIAAFMLGVLAMNAAHHGSTSTTSTPAWSGNEAPPGAVGLSPERDALHGPPGSGAERGPSQ